MGKKRRGSGRLLLEKRGRGFFFLVSFVATGKKKRKVRRKNMEKRNSEQTRPIRRGRSSQVNTHAFLLELLYVRECGFFFPSLSLFFFLRRYLFVDKNQTKHNSFAKKKMIGDMCFSLLRRSMEGEKAPSKCTQNIQHTSK